MKAYMYILECADGSLYTDSTRYLKLRMFQHQSGEGGSQTESRLPVNLIYSEEYDQMIQAYDREKQVRQWSRAKLEDLISGALHLLKNRLAS